MGKLTNYSREQIVRAILRHRFSGPAAALLADRAAFATEVYNDIYLASDRKKMAALPKGWLPEEGSISVQFGDSRGYCTVCFNGTEYSSHAKMLADAAKFVTRRVQYSHHRGCAKVFETTDRMTVAYQALRDRTNALNKEIDDAERQTTAAVASVSTVGRLIEQWPEVTPFAEKFSSTPTKLPSIPVEKLNTMLKLPVTKELRK